LWKEGEYAICIVGLVPCIAHKIIARYNSEQ